MSIRPATVSIGKRFVRAVVFAICFFPIFQWQSARAACGSFSGLIRHGSYAVADAGGRIISSCNVDTPLVPASILKIPTALAALHILGNTFRFRTDLLVDQQHNLYIKGYGDPMLTSEEVALILHHLHGLGVDRINGIFIDDSNYRLSAQIPGRGDSDNPYDAAIGAVAVNFNTVKIRVDGKGMVVSDEPQTPTLPLMKQLGQGFRPGVYRLNICWKNCRPEEKTARYAAELFRGLQRRAGIPGDGPLGLRKAPTDSRLVYTHRNSKKLAEVLSSLLKYSNNLIADQVFFGLRYGAKRFSRNLGQGESGDRSGTAAHPRPGGRSRHRHSGRFRPLPPGPYDRPVHDSGVAGLCSLQRPVAGKKGDAAEIGNPGGGI